MKGKTILVVEDERPLLEIAQLNLEGAGFDVLTARSSAQALDFLRHVGSVDLIWLDHYLLGKDNGLTFVRYIKGRPEWQHIPIIVVSNSASDETRRLYKQSGVDVYYVKSDTPLDKIMSDISPLLMNAGTK